MSEDNSIQHERDNNLINHMMEFFGERFKQLQASSEKRFKQLQASSEERFKQLRANNEKLPERVVSLEVKNNILISLNNSNNILANNDLYLTARQKNVADSVITEGTTLAPGELDIILDDNRNNDDDQQKEEEIAN